MKKGLHHHGAALVANNTKTKNCDLSSPVGSDFKTPRKPTDTQCPREVYVPYLYFGYQRKEILALYVESHKPTKINSSARGSVCTQSMN